MGNEDSSMVGSGGPYLSRTRTKIIKGFSRLRKMTDVDLGQGEKILSYIQEDSVLLPKDSEVRSHSVIGGFVRKFPQIFLQNIMKGR